MLFSVKSEKLKTSNEYGNFEQFVNQLVAVHHAEIKAGSQAFDLARTARAAGARSFA